MSNEWNAFRSMNAGQGWSAKKMSREYSNSFGRSCTGLRKTINPKCEDEPGCTWYVNKGCRSSGSTEPQSKPRPQSETPIGNCARCAKTVRRKNCPGGVCGGNGLCHWCVGEGCREIGYECKRAAASATKQAKAHAAREKRAKTLAEKEAARRAKEQAKAHAKQAREDAKRAKEQERKAKEAARKAKAAEAKRRRDDLKAEEKRRRDEERRAKEQAKAEEKRRRNEERRKEQHKKANACKENVQKKLVTRELDPSNTRNTHLAYLLENCPHSPSYGGTFEFLAAGMGDVEMDIYWDAIETYNTWREVWAAFVACNPGISSNDIDRAHKTFVRAVDHSKEKRKEFDDHFRPKTKAKAKQTKAKAKQTKAKAEPKKPPRIPNCDELERDGGLNDYEGCGYEENGYYCNVEQWYDEDPAVLFYNAVEGAQWEGKYGTEPDGINDAIAAFNEWKMVVDYYHECRAEGADVVNAMNRFYTIMDHISDQMNPNAHYSRGVHDAFIGFVNSKRRSGGSEEKKCDRNEQQRTLEQNPKCQGESIFCDPFNNPDVQYLKELLNTAWGGKNGPMPKKLMPASEALTSWREVHALYLRCKASAEDVLKEMDKFNILIDQVASEIQERADSRAKAPPPKAKAAPHKDTPCNEEERRREIGHLTPFSINIYPALAEMVIVWPKEYPNLPKLNIQVDSIDIRPYYNEYMSIPSDRKKALFVAWIELANAFDNYVECRGPLSDFRQARRNFRNVEEDYKQHANEEDVGAGGGAGQGGNYSGARAGAHCNSGELAKARNYAEAIYNIGKNTKGVSKAKIIKLIRGVVPDADLRGLTKNELIDWARQLFGVPGGEVRQEDGSRDAFEHYFAEYDLNDDRYLDNSELVWAKCSNGFGYSDVYLKK